MWLGHARCSNECLIGTDEGVVRAYIVIRKPAGERWNAEKIRSMRGTPQSPDPKSNSIHVPIRIHLEEAAQDAEETSRLPRAEGVRRRRITAQTLRRYGFTEGCDGCTYARAGMGEHRGHTEECRRRIEEEM